MIWDRIAKDMLKRDNWPDNWGRGLDNHIQYMSPDKSRRPEGKNCIHIWVDSKDYSKVVYNRTTLYNINVKKNIQKK